MLKFQVALIALLIGCVALISCDIVQELVPPVMPDEDAAAEDMAAEDMAAEDMAAEDMAAEDMGDDEAQ